MESRGGYMALILGLIQLAMAACPDQEKMLESAERLLFEGQLEKADQQHRQIFVNLDCEEGFDSEWVNRLWVFEAVLRHYQGAEEAALLAFQSSSELDQWPEMYGPELKHQRESALAIAPDPIPLRLTVPRRYTVIVDGTHSDSMTLLTPSPHLLQIRSPDNQHQLSLRHNFSTGTPVLPELPRVRSKGLGVGSVVLNGGALAALAIAQHQASQIRSADSSTEVEQGFRHQQNALTSAAVLGAAGLTLGMTWWLW